MRKLPARSKLSHENLGTGKFKGHKLWVFLAAYNGDLTGRRSRDLTVLR